MMNLDEAIQHCEEVAKDRNETANLTPTEYGDYINSCRECAEEHEQLAEWLMELKKLREENVNQFLNSKNIILALIEENKALRKQRPQGEFTRKELESWLYEIAGNNLGDELGRSCEEIIRRLDGFERFVSDMRKGGAG